MTTTQNDDKITKKAVKKAEKKAAKKAEKKAAKKAVKKVSMKNVVFVQRSLPPKQIVPRKPNAHDIIAMHVLASNTSKVIRELNEWEQSSLRDMKHYFYVASMNDRKSGRKLNAQEFIDICYQLHTQNPKIVRRLDADEESDLFMNGNYCHDDRENQDDEHN